MRIERTDLAVIGAGPAGLAAATEAATAGVDVLLLDENPGPGGQIWRSLPNEFTSGPSGDAAEPAARRLLGALASSSVRTMFGATVWGSFEPGRLEVASGGAAIRVEAKQIVIAAGAHDRPVPLPGWTLPGVMTVGGGQTLLKGQRGLVGTRVLLAGTGPLLLVVAAQLARAGARIVAVVESAATFSLASRFLALSREPRLMARGLSYRLALMRRSVPWLASSVLLGIEGEEQVTGARVASLDARGQVRSDSERRLECDAVLVGYGLVPSVELLRLLNCGLRWDGNRDSFVPERTADFETTVSGVFAVGDGAGVAGAVVAVEEGRLAGIAVARGLGRLTAEEARARQEPSRRRLARLQGFREAMDCVYRVPPVLSTLATEDTILCRCEEVTIGEVGAALRDGACHPAQVKLWTRAGMGPCQGRMCHLPTVGLLARSLGRTPEDIGGYGVRPPVKPLDVGALLDITREAS